MRVDRSWGSSCMLLLLCLLWEHTLPVESNRNDGAGYASEGGSSSAPLQEAIKVDSLVTEYLDSPLGVDKAVPRVSWRIRNPTTQNENQKEANGRVIRRGIFQRAYQLRVSSRSSPSGSSSMSIWRDCGWVVSNETSLVPLNCKGLTPISTSDMNVSWKVSVKLDDGSVIESDVASFRTGLFDPWKARWINGGKRADDKDKEKTLFRKEFFLSKRNNNNRTTSDSSDHHHATLFVAGLGYNHIYLNGIKVSDHQLDPGWTNYTKRVWYSTYDVTDMLRFDGGGNSNNSNSNNVIAAMLGNGWWSCGPPPGTALAYCSDDPPQLILQLHVDGRPVLLSDETWKVSEDSPVLYNSLYNGEVYDARIAERIGRWKSLGYCDSSWETAALANNKVATEATLASQLFEPIRHVSTRSPVSIVVSGSNDRDNNLTQVIDFGQNQAAVVRLKRFFCASGTTVALRHAELVVHPPYGDYDNATIYVDNLRTAKANDYYVCSGNPGGESYTPTFTQHGFRYVEITGLNYTLDPSDVEAVELHTDVTERSSVSFADPLLNKIQRMVLWGLKTNLMSVQTDCDQRDERKGWMGDAALTAEAAVISYGMGAFYTHWLVGDFLWHR